MLTLIGEFHDERLIFYIRFTFYYIDFFGANKMSKNNSFFSFFLVQRSNNIFYCDVIRWFKHLYFTEWSTGFYLTWKSQYFTSINTIIKHIQALTKSVLIISCCNNCAYLVNNSSKGMAVGVLLDVGSSFNICTIYMLNC